MSLETLFDKTVDFERAALEDDGMGGQREIWNIVFAGVACAIQPVRGLEAVLWNRETATTTHHLYCKPLVITAADRVNFGGRIFDIKVIRDVDEANRLLVLDLKEVQ